MTDDEHVAEIRKRVDRMDSRSQYADLVYLLDRLAVAERRGMERAAEIAEGATGGLALSPAETGRQIAAVIRDEAEKL